MACEVMINEWDPDSLRIALSAGARNRGFSTEATRLIVEASPPRSTNRPRSTRFLSTCSTSTSGRLTASS